MNDRIFDYITGCLSFVYATCHLLIVILILTCREICEKKSNQLLLNMSIGHAFCGFTNVAGTMLPLSHPTISSIIYAAYSYSNIALVMLTIDRCLYIRWPFRYDTIPLLLHIFFMAISPLSCGYIIYRAITTENITHVHSNVAAMKAFIFGIGVIMTLLLAANSIVFCTLQSQKRKIEALRVGTSSTMNARTSLTRRRKEILTFYICLGCVLTYVVLWLPSTVVTIINLYTQVTISYYYFSLSIIAVSFNPLSDAVIFVWFNKDLKKRLFKLGCFKGCSTNASANDMNGDATIVQASTTM